MCTVGSATPAVLTTSTNVSCADIPGLSKRRGWGKFREIREVDPPNTDAAILAMTALVTMGSLQGSDRPWHLEARYV